MAIDEGPRPITISIAGECTIPADRVNEIGAAFVTLPIGGLTAELGAAVQVAVDAVLDALGCERADTTVSVSITGGANTVRATAPSAPA